MKKLFPIILGLLSFSLAHAQRNDLIGNRILSYITDTVKTVSKDNYYLIHLDQRNVETDRIIRKLEGDYAIIKATTDEPPLVRSKYFSLDNQWKLSRRISNRQLSNSKDIICSVKYAKGVYKNFFSDMEDVELITIMESSSIAIIKTNLNIIKNRLILDKRIEFIDLLTKDASEESPIRQYNPYLNRISTAKHLYPMLNGEDLTISVKEHSIFDNDIDLIGKVILDDHSSKEFTQHAKEMGTLIAGRGNSYYTGEGVVPKSQLVSTDFLSLFAEEPDYYKRYGISIQNHSYGTGIENYYSNESLSYDQSCVDEHSLIHVFSAGNLGNETPKEGMYSGVQGYANLTGTFKQAKNVILVAAIDSVGNMVGGSSSGPAYDGRIKPELCAFGGEGSSESAALASGSIAMIQHHYEIKYKKLPASSLVKSLMITGANDVNIPGIDFKTGYGSINLHRTLQLMDSSWFYESTVLSNEFNSSELNIPENVQELKVVLSWIDPPANPEDVAALVNDIDLTLITPTSEVMLPWVLDHSPDINLLSAQAQRGTDQINNVEMITIKNPAQGKYIIHVLANQLTGDGQKFSIAYSIKQKDTFEWTFPTSSDNIQAGSKALFFWENTFSNQEGNLLIKYGEGSWETIGSSELDNKYYKATVKDTSIYAMLKMEWPGHTYISDTFSVSKVPEIQVENDCKDEVVLSWAAIDNSLEYQLYELKSNVLTPTLATPDTLIKLNKTVYTGSNYALTAIQNSGRAGIRSYTINLENSNKGCYISNFLAYLDIEKSGSIQLSLNIPQKIQTVEIMKEYQGEYELFEHFSPGNQSQFKFKDDDLFPGRSTYFTKLEVANGNEYYSDTLSFFYTDKNTIIVFPNPVKDDYVNILNDYPGSTLRLINENGAFVSQYEIESTLDFLNISNLRKGLYLFQLWHENKVVGSGKIIKL